MDQKKKYFITHGYFKEYIRGTRIYILEADSREDLEKGDYEVYEHYEYEADGEVQEEVPYIELAIDADPDKTDDQIIEKYTKSDLIGRIPKEYRFS